MTDILAKNFGTRQELEKFIASKVGLTAENKPDWVIKGTKMELKALYLAHAKSCWGIRCEAADYEQAPKAANINRGKVVKAKLGRVNINKSKEV